MKLIKINKNQVNYMNQLKGMCTERERPDADKRMKINNRSKNLILSMFCSYKVTYQATKDEIDGFLSLNI